MNGNKINLLPTVVILALLGVMLAMPQCEKMERFDDGMRQNDRLNEAELKAAVISDAEKEAILFMREEEKLARDVYAYFNEIFESDPFTNILASEDRHMEALKRLIISLGLVDPVVDDSRGVFVNQELNDLYLELTDPQYSSWEAALEAGIVIENMDIEDLEFYLDPDEPVAVSANVIRVFENLLAGSERHLDAFESHLDAAIVVLAAITTPVTLTPSEEEAILHMREEEKLAYDVYAYFYEFFPVFPLENIIPSESRHMAAVKRLIDCFGLVDPVGENGLGIFTNPDLQLIYDDLTSSESPGWKEVLEAGVAIETLDIEDLEFYLDPLAPLAVSENVVRVFEYLLAGSERHLAAFIRHLEAFSE